MSDIDKLKKHYEEALENYRTLGIEGFNKNMQKRNRIKHIKTTTIAILSMSLGFLIAYKLAERYESLILPMLLTAGLILASFALRYLQPSTNLTDRKNIESEWINLQIEQQVAKALKTATNEGLSKTLDFTSEDKAQILSGIQAKLESDALEEFLIELRKLTLTNVREESFDEQFVFTRQRLGQEIQALAKRGNLNLILGISTTITGLVVLGYAVFAPPSLNTAAEILAYFVPRVSLVLLIEVFAYFFLKLYKQSLGEIKYFQNEITNVEAKNLALQVALRADDSALRSKVAEALAATERNFILSKDQTTVDLERDRITHTFYANFADSVKEIIKRKD